jgi:RNA polymerase sigma-70 factor (ECF subfamily)
MAIDASTTPMEAAREHALVASARADAAAFGELYDAYLPHIYGFIARRVEDRTVAEDLTAATFKRALGAVRGTDLGNASFGGFLYRVAASAVVDHARRARRAIPPGVRASDLDDEGDAEAAESMAIEAATRAFAAAIDRSRLRRALVGMSEDHRRVLVLRYFDRLETDELCAVLGSSRQSFAVLVHRALRELRSAMDKAAIDAA